MAIAAYCALLAGKGFAGGVRLAINHYGDSDSAGAIAGNISGTLVGRSAIQKSWLVDLELRHTVEQISARLFSVFDKL